MRDSPYLRRLPGQFLGAVMLCIVMGVTGPFGTYGTMKLHGDRFTIAARRRGLHANCVE